MKKNYIVCINWAIYNRKHNNEGIDSNEKGELYSKAYNYEEIEEKAGVKLENTIG